jgi:Transposase, Mutator family
VLIGATPEGKKELVGFQVGVRESAQSWRELLVEVKRRGWHAGLAGRDAISVADDEGEAEPPAASKAARRFGMSRSARSSSANIRAKSTRFWSSPAASAGGDMSIRAFRRSPGRLRA